MELDSKIKNIVLWKETTKMIAKVLKYIKNIKNLNSIYGFKISNKIYNGSLRGKIGLRTLV